MKNNLGQILTSVLATTYDLYLKTQNFHWNVVGPNFVSLHAFFEKQYEELAEAADLLAERIRALHLFVPANFESFRKLSEIQSAKGPLSEKLMIKALHKDHSTLCKTLKKTIPLCDKVNDLATQDILIERLRSHEKTLWMLQSLLS